MAFTFNFFGFDAGAMDALRTVISARAAASGDNAMASVKVTGVVSGDDVSGSVIAKAVAEDSNNAASATADTSFFSSDPDIVVEQVEESNEAEDGSFAEAISQLTFESPGDDDSADELLADEPLADDFSDDAAVLDGPVLAFGQDEVAWIDSPTIPIESYFS